MRMLFGLYLALGLLSVAPAGDDRDVSSQIKTAIKIVANGKDFSTVQRQRLDRLFGGSSQSEKFVSQIRQFWGGKMKRRLTGIKLFENVRLQPAIWIDIRYRIGTVDTGTEYMQQLYLERINELWRVLRFTKITVAPIVLNAPAPSPGQFFTQILGSNLNLRRLSSVFLVKHDNCLLTVKDIGRIPVVHGIHYGFKPISSLTS